MRSIPFIYLISTLCALTLLITTGSAAGTEILVITDSRHPVSGAGKLIRVIELDVAQHIEADLSDQLPNDPQLAVALVQRRLHEGGQRMLQQLRDTYQGVADAWSLGIITIPAIVIDQRYVIYGESNLDLALTRVEQYRKEQP